MDTAQKTLAPTGSKLRTDVIRLGLFNKLDYEVAVWPGRSDFGAVGWFLGKESNCDEGERARGREDELFPSVFFEGDDAKQRAIEAGMQRESSKRWSRR